MLFDVRLIIQVFSFAYSYWCSLLAHFCQGDSSLSAAVKSLEEDCLFDELENTSHAVLFCGLHHLDTEVN